MKDVDSIKARLSALEGVVLVRPVIGFCGYCKMAGAQASAVRYEVAADSLYKAIYYYAMCEKCGAKANLPVLKMLDRRTKQRA